MSLEKRVYNTIEKDGSKGENSGFFKRVKESIHQNRDYYKGAIYGFLEKIRDSRYGRLLNHINPTSEKFKSNLATTLGGQFLVASPFYFASYSLFVGVTNNASLENRAISLALGYFFINKINYQLRESFHDKRKKLKIPILSRYSESVQRRVTDVPFNSVFTSAVCCGIYALNCALGFDNFDAEKIYGISLIGASLGAVIGPAMGYGIDLACNLLDVKSTQKKVSSLSKKTKKKIMKLMLFGSLALNTGIYGFMPDSSQYGYEPTLPYLIMEKVIGQDL